MRAIWKGSISFGLVNIPISLYPATRREELEFRLLRASDLSPIQYKRVAEADGKEVPWDQIVKGYEYEKDQFVVLKEEDFERADLQATQTVEITDFVALDDINPMFFQKPFYMEPGKGGTKAYVLLRDALSERARVGIAKVVIKTRQYLAAVKPSGKALLLETMHFVDELIEPESLQLPSAAQPSKGEMEMARALIDRMSDKWHPEKYQDDYRTALLKLIEKKIEAGGREVEIPKARPKRLSNVIDLVDVLKKSLGEAEAKKAPRKHAEKRSTRVKRKKVA
jgi:DNA end-binding protein Ku